MCDVVQRGLVHVLPRFEVNFSNEKIKKLESRNLNLFNEQETGISKLPSGVLLLSFECWFIAIYTSRTHEHTRVTCVQTLG